MAKVATITGAVNGQNIRIEYNVGVLDLNVKISKATGFADYLEFLGRFSNTEIEVNKQTRAGMVNVLNRGKLMQYFELAQSNKGLIIVDATNLTAPTIESAVELCERGSITLKDGEFFEVNFFNLPAEANESLEIELSALDSEDVATRANIYEKHYFNAGAPREISLQGVKTIAIPTADCDKVELVYENGRRVQKTKRDLQAIQRDELMVRNYVKVATGTHVNVINALVLHNVAFATAAKITTLNNTNVLLLKQELLPIR